MSPPDVLSLPGASEEAPTAFRGSSVARCELPVNWSYVEYGETG